MSMTPTQRSLALLRSEGWTVAVVEKWNSHIRIRQDLFGFADLLGFRHGWPVWLIQTTSGSNAAARRTKIQENPHAQEWLRCGHGIELHSWAKRGERGKRKLWTCKRETIGLHSPEPVAE